MDFFYNFLAMIELDEKSQQSSSYFNLEWKNLSYIPRKKIDQQRSFNIFNRSKKKEVRVLDNGNVSHLLITTISLFQLNSEW